jgi:hypothetical protein
MNVTPELAAANRLDDDKTLVLRWFACGAPVDPSETSSYTAAL